MKNDPIEPTDHDTMEDTVENFESFNDTLICKLKDAANSGKFTA
jgi:hypothetical protein